MKFGELLLACDNSTAVRDVSSPAQSLGVGSPLPPRREGLRSGSSTPYSGEEGRTWFGKSHEHQSTAPGSEEHLHNRGREGNMAGEKDKAIELSVVLSGEVTSSMEIDLGNSSGTCLRRHPRRLSFERELRSSKSVETDGLRNQGEGPVRTLRSKRKDMASPHKEPESKAWRGVQDTEIALTNTRSRRLSTKGNTVSEPSTPRTCENLPKKSLQNEVIEARLEKNTEKSEQREIMKELMKVNCGVPVEGRSGNLGKRTRGRPRKVTVSPVEEKIAVVSEAEPAESIPRRRGRPQKAQTGGSNLNGSNGADESLIAPSVKNSSPSPLETVGKCVETEVTEPLLETKIRGDVEDNVGKAVSGADVSPRRPGDRPKKLPLKSLKGKKPVDVARDLFTPGVCLRVHEMDEKATSNLELEGVRESAKMLRGRPRKLQSLLSQENDITVPGTKSSNVDVSEDRPAGDETSEDSKMLQVTALPEKILETVDLAKNTLQTQPIASPVPEGGRAYSEEALRVDSSTLSIKDAEEVYKGKNPSRIPSAAINDSDKGSACVTPDPSEKTLRRSRGRPKKIHTAETEFKYSAICAGDSSKTEVVQIQTVSSTHDNAPCAEQSRVSFTVASSLEIATRNSVGSLKPLQRPSPNRDPVQRESDAEGEEQMEKAFASSPVEMNQGTGKRPGGRPKKTRGRKVVRKLEGGGVERGSLNAARIPRSNLHRKDVENDGGTQEQNEKVGRKRGRPRKGIKQLDGSEGRRKEAVGRRRPADGQCTGAVKEKKLTQETSRRGYLTKVVLDGLEFRIGDDVYVRKPGFTCSETEAEVEDCQICGMADDRTMLECDRCLGGFHLSCLKPPLEEVPEDDWECFFCAYGVKPPVQLQNKLGKRRSAREMLLAGELWAAQIEKEEEKLNLWEALGRMWSEHDGTYWFKARWFLIPEETSSGRQRHTGSRELFRSSQSDINEMDSIFRHCYVMSPDEYKRSAREGDDVFYCEYEYNERWCRFKRIDYDNHSLTNEGSEDEAYNPSDESGKELDVEEERSRQPKLGKKLKQGRSPKAANKRQSFSSGIQEVGAKNIVDRPRKAPQSDFERAKAALTLSAVPPSMPCRDSERAEIATFLNDSVGAGEQCLGHCLYISGVPGTGKTATVREVIKDLETKVDAGELPAFRFVEINGLRLPSPDHVYTVLHEALTGQHLGWKKAVESLDDRFSSSKHLKGSDARPCVLLIDELDVLVNRNQSVLYNIFDWPSRPHSRLVVIGIANTMDLPERMLPRIASRMGMKRISFSPYSHKQLEEIIASRLEGVRIFDKQAAEFASRKVAAVSGDIRRALELCRRAVEVAEARIAEHESSFSPANDQSLADQVPEGTPATPRVVTMADVDAAICQLFEAPQIQMMQRSSKLAKIFLTAMVCDQHRTSMVETTFEKVSATCSELCANNGEDIPDNDTLIGVGCKLGALRLLLCEPGARHKLQKLQLNFPCDDVSFALKKDIEVPWLCKYL